MANRGMEIKDADETDFNIELEHWLQIDFQHSSLAGQFSVLREYPELRNSPKTKKSKGLRRQVDLAIRLANGQRILALEGKRLHNPNDKQYVSGNTGGIARFKREDHGKELALSCMIGYVQSETFSFWHEKINSWIVNEQSTTPDLSWHDVDLLSIPQEKGTTLVMCTSRHQRTTQAVIDLCHFWVRIV